MKQQTRNENHVKLMIEHWANSAAIAWKAYNDDGRCALIVNPDEVAQVGSFVGWVAFLKNDNMQQAPDDLKKALREYNPQKEVVFIFEDSDLVTFWVTSHEPAPPAAGEYYEVI